MAKSKKTTKSTKVAKTKVEEPIEQPVKRKKRHRGLKVLIVLLTIFVVLPVAFFFGAIYDPSSKDNLPKNELAYQNLVSTMISDGMANVRKEKAMSMEFNEEMLDGVMLYACNQLNKKDYVPQMYCDIHDNNYDFYIELKASFLKTRVKIGTSLTKVDEGDPEKETLVFKVNELKIGRLPIPLNWITSITSNFITDQQIEDIFGKTGFKFKCSFADLQLTYARKQFLTDVESLLVEYAGNNEYINIFLDAFGYDDILTTEFTDKVKVKFNLKPLSENKIYNKEHFFDFDGDSEQRLENHAIAIKEWLNHGYFDEETATSVFTFLLRGNKSDETTKSKINALDNTFMTDSLLNYLKTMQSDLTIGSALTDDFKGSIINNSNKQFANYCDSDIKNIVTNLGVTVSEVSTWFTTSHNEPLDIVKMNENNLNKFLASIEGAIGNVTLITSLNNNKWNADYVILDNLYVDFDKYGTNDYKMCMYFGLNINGFPTTIVIPTEIDFKKDASQMSLYFNLDRNEDDSCEVFLGDIPLSEDTQDILFEKMEELVKDSAFKFDINNKRFEINISEFIPSDLGSVLDIIKNYLAYTSDDDALTFQLIWHE